jgi:hypothetical protein
MFICQCYGFTITPGEYLTCSNSELIKNCWTCDINTTVSFVYREKRPFYMIRDRRFVTSKRIIHDLVESFLNTTTNKGLSLR